MPKTVEPPLVVVEWEDATHISTWESLEDARDFERMNLIDWHCTNVGYLIRDDEECVIVAARATADFRSVGLFERIPRGMVKKITYLRRR